MSSLVDCQNLALFVEPNSFISEALKNCKIFHKFNDNVEKMECLQSSLGCKALSEKVITSLESCLFTEVLNRGELRANQLTSGLTTPQMLHKVSNEQVGCKEHAFTAIYIFSKL